MAGFSGNGGNFHCALLNFGYFEVEKLLHKTRVGAAHGNGGALETFIDFGDKHSKPRAVLVFFAGYLLFGGQQSLHITKVNVNHSRVGALLNDSRHNVAVFTPVFTEYPVVSNVSNALINYLLCRVGGNFLRHAFFHERALEYIGTTTARA